MSEKIDDFVQKEAPLKAIVVDYYLNFIPYFMNMYSPMVVFLTVILFTSKMAQNSEIVAILSCGVSFHRMMVPYLVSACIVALVSMGLGLWVIPRANVTRVAFEQKYNPRAKVKFGHDMHYKLEENRNHNREARRWRFRYSTVIGILEKNHEILRHLIQVGIRSIAKEELAQLGYRLEFVTSSGREGCRTVCRCFDIVFFDMGSHY